MDVLLSLCSIIITTSLWISLCASDDSLVPGKPLSPGRTLVSNGGAFALGFFTPTDSNTTSYLGIWYNIIPLRTVVWVANRDRPIAGASAASVSLAVANHSGSNLVLSDSNGAVLWATNLTGGAAGATAVLQNTGNLALQSPGGAVLWQSFDYPTDTFLPTMQFRLTHKTRPAERLVSWRSPSDPSPGEFSFGADPSTYLQLLTWQGSSPYWRGGVLHGELVTAVYDSTARAVLYQTIVSTGEEVYMSFGFSDGASARYTLDFSGKAQLLRWNSGLSQWVAITTTPARINCNRYGFCGPNGHCDNTEAVPTCKCLDGYEPKSSNLSDGCRRKKALQCRGGRDGFLTVPGMKLPDKFLFVRNRSLDECAAECSSNCSCTAYAYANLSSNNVGGDASRCLVWMGELVDAEKIGTSGENLYLHLADLGGSRKKSNVAKIIVPVLASILVFIAIFLACRYRIRAKWRSKESEKRLVLGDLTASEELVQAQNLQFPFISFEDILVATNNFSASNMLGEGGFGKVYKGMLDGGNEVAIKRLSKGSGQGIEEFRNEVALIAKLQHRNLVRLLGCCIQGDEKLLVYEYLPNKSLDAFLFDGARKSVLDWSTRFNIIKGVGRGLLYLHQDSRLKIIHRDLKASNILLDAEMSPKISDFGMARIFGGNQQQANTNRVVGTYGYMSPEYAMEGAFSVKSDVYSFGVLLLEIVSGFKISSPHLMEFPNLIAYAWSLWKEGKAKDLVDSSVMESCTLDEALRCIHIGLLCVQDNPSARPLMSLVVFMLENRSTPLPDPKQPLYFSQRNHKAEPSEDHNIQNSVNSMTVTIVEGR